MLGRRLLRFTGWGVLALSIAVIYNAYVVVYTYYSPFGVLLVTAMAGLVVVLGAIEFIMGGRGTTSEGFRQFSNFVNLINRYFPLSFAVAVSAVVIDIALTLFGLANFGLDLERNQAVASLLRNGSTLTWLSLQLAPLAIAGSAYMVFKKSSIRVAINFYVIATAGYAIYVAANNALVLAQLTGLF